MKLHCLASSSQGNCYLIDMKTKNGDTTFLIECGIPYKDIITKMAILGRKCSDIEFCLVTHGHSDHAKSIKDFVSRRFYVYASKSTFQMAKVENPNTIPLREGVSVYVNDDIIVTPFLVEHDAPESLGFIVQSSKESFLFVNDCKYFKPDLSMFKFDYVFIECNYDQKVVYTLYNEAKKAQDKILDKQYGRLLNSHMGLATTIKQLKKLDLSMCKCIFLMHLSDGHANEHRMKMEIEKQFGIPVYVCKKVGGII